MKTLVSWSSGKDSAWMLHVLKQDPSIEIGGLLTTMNEQFDRVAMHAVRRRLLEAQADAAGVPLRTVRLPWPCTNEQYEDRMRRVHGPHTCPHDGDIRMRSIEPLAEQRPFEFCRHTQQKVDGHRSLF